MATDLNQGYNDVKSNVSSLKTFKEAKSNIKKIKSNAANSQAKTRKTDYRRRLRINSVNY